ncbi:hypothetical protein PACTADRAFT_185009 [Pachysolen tannophilus NRRL Y-2460]|uniref:Sm domain-containing protein n=1 Tax=Pachysolen tannophilus NRRL Y-2460 TaxID=669874 RepID=A0A1E4U380_PACTA|nr:hypothetical protein PACTADRAFT_185009 [Pachysolen tannophilus NRRL Y-2460]
MEHNNSGNNYSNSNSNSNYGGYNNRQRNSNNSNNNNNNNRRQERKPDGPKREAILDLAKYQDQKIIVEFVGGRQVIGVLKGYDQLMNLVLDEVEENLRDESGKLLDETRSLGLVIVRGPLLLTLSPVDGTEVIDNPFANTEE